MGICSSCDSNHAATAKLILQDGRLQEFPYPAKVSYVLQMNPTCFVCNSDEMDFHDVLSPIGQDEELLPGQLYFALPLSWLKHPLQAEEMAALAVKASSALMHCNNGGEKCGCICKSVALFPVSEESLDHRAPAGFGYSCFSNKFEFLELNFDGKLNILSINHTTVDQLIYFMQGDQRNFPSG